jgi:hypothetical protein
MQHVDVRMSSATPACLRHGDGDIIVLHGGGVGGGAHEAGLLYSYLKGGGPLPKCIVGSSIGAMIAVSLHQAASEVAGDGPAAVRQAMLDTLEDMFVSEFPKANMVTKVMGLLPKFNAEAQPKSQAATFLQLSGLARLPVRGAAPFDVGVAVTELDADGAPATSRLVWNSDIDAETMNATAAHKHVQPVNGRVDGNYGDYLGSLSQLVKEGQKMQFFTTYQPNDAAGTANLHTAAGLAALKAKGADITVSFAAVPEEQRHEMGGTGSSFMKGVEQGRGMFKQRPTAPDVPMFR